MDWAGHSTNVWRSVPVGNVAVGHQRFTGNPWPLVFEVLWWETSDALAQPCAAANAVDRRRLYKPSCPARLILFRWAAENETHDARR